MNKICVMAKGDARWDEVSEYARGISWHAGPMLARKMDAGDFADWERVLALYVDGAPRGFCTLTERDELPEGYGFTPHIGYLFVDERCRGHRHSLKLIERAMEYAGSLGYDRIYLMSGEKGLYEKYGFEKLGVYKTIYDTVDQLFTRAIPEDFGENRPMSSEGHV